MTKTSSFIIAFCTCNLLCIVSLCMSYFIARKAFWCAELIVVFLSSILEEGPGALLASNASELFSLPNTA